MKKDNLEISLRIKQSIQGKVALAKRKGILIPKPCEICGKKALAHHEDYSKPLKVKWICSHHHSWIHMKVPRKIKTWNKKINWIKNYIDKLEQKALGKEIK